MSAAPLWKETVIEPVTPFEDIGPYLDGTAKLIVPTVADVGGGRRLFYTEAINEIHGEPSVGKTNILLAAAGSVLAAGGSVIFLDPEDTPARIVPRCLALGLDREAMRHGFHYRRSPLPEDYQAAHLWAAVTKPSLVILDGLAEALAAESKDENSVADVLDFFRDRLKPFAEAGCAVVVADHVIKATEGRGRWARGTGAKLGHYNGASYEISLGEAYTPTKAGFVRLKVSKDRNGGVGPQGAIVAELHFAPDEGRTVAEWREPEAKGYFKPTAIMEKIVRHLRTFGEASKRDLRSLGNSDWVDKATEILLAEGTISRRQVAQSHRFALVKKDSEQ